MQTHICLQIIYSRSACIGTLRRQGGGSNLEGRSGASTAPVSRADFLPDMKEIKFSKSRDRCDSKESGLSPETRLPQFDHLPNFENL
ncbi:hypothetical protein HK28_11645 [Acetobacter sp. DsW_063]|nr:hypothetical protein HK28_11645 [Acetobacter sp. DsW_063]